MNPTKHNAIGAKDRRSEEAKKLFNKIDLWLMKNPLRSFNRVLYQELQDQFIEFGKISEKQLDGLRAIIERHGI